MNRKYLYPILIVLVTVGLYYAEKYVDRQSEAYPDTTGVSEEFKVTEFGDSLLPSSTTGEIVEHGYYTLSYAEEHEQAEWVAYELAKNHLSKRDIERPYFVQDRSVSTGSADWRNYKNSGYDRGHLCPAGDRRFDYQAYHETFLTSNISPQDREFNGGIWNRLEQKTRYWAEHFDGVYVVTGGVLTHNLETIGDEGVSVPKAFYKIIINQKADRLHAVAFLIPNKPSNKSFFDYAVTIDSIEEQTGIDFFPKLPRDIQEQLEASVDLKAWNRR